MNIQALISTIESAGFTVDLVEGGTELVMACPLCFSEARKLYISTDHGGFICFVCNERGSLRRLLITVCELNFNEATVLERVILQGKKRAAVTVPRPAPPSTVELPSEFRPLTLDMTPDSHGGGAVWYLEEGRNIGLRQAVVLGIGFCLTGPYAYRVIVPVYTQGKLRTFVARTWIAEEKKKVLMPPGSQASRALFGYDTLYKERAYWRNIILVEGVFDAINMWQVGYRETVATLGAHLTELQRSLVKRLKPERVVILGDADDAGREAAIKEARELTYDMLQVSIANLPEGTDPGSASPTEIRQALDTAKPVEMDYGIESQKEVHRCDT
jgi:DNA primase